MTKRRISPKQLFAGEAKNRLHLYLCLATSYNKVLYVKSKYNIARKKQGIQIMFISFDFFKINYVNTLIQQQQT